MIILGIDPGFDRVGWAVIEKKPTTTTLLMCGAVTTSKKDILPVRLAEIHDELQSVIDQFHPEVASIESLFFTNNVTTGIPVAEARGVIVMTCHSNGLKIQEWTPPQVKSSVAGDGRADKKAVEKMVRLIVKNVPPKVLDDTIDAIALALCS